MGDSQLTVRLNKESKYDAKCGAPEVPTPFPGAICHPGPFFILGRGKTKTQKTQQLRFDFQDVGNLGASVIGLRPITGPAPPAAASPLACAGDQAPRKALSALGPPPRVVSVAPAHVSCLGARFSSPSLYPDGRAPTAAFPGEKRDAANVSVMGRGRGPGSWRAQQGQATATRRPPRALTTMCSLPTEPMPSKL